jgi:tetraacyldisaccharide 4'-kinase
MLPAAWLFRAAVAARNAAYDRGLIAVRRLPVPVISVGNLSVGGTGKTPVVAALAAWLLEHGRRPAIASRGHGGAHARRRGAAPLVVSSGAAGGSIASALEAGDEPALLASLLPGVPIIVSPHRFEAGGLAVREHAADLILLDDGFQHRRLFREADLVTLDARGLPDGYLLPAGPWREPASGLRRAHVAVLTRAEADADWEAARQAIGALVPGLPVHRARHVPVGLRRASPDGLGPRATLSGLEGVPIAGFAGLARPLDFRDTLESLGARVVAFTSFPDHHPFSREAIERLAGEARRAGASLLMTTAKDAVRLPFIPPDLAVLDIEVRIEGMDDLGRRLLSLCSAAGARDGAAAGRSDSLAAPPKRLES